MVTEASVPVCIHRVAFLRQNAMYETLHGADVETHGLQWGRGSGSAASCNDAYVMTRYLQNRNPLRSDRRGFLFIGGGGQLAS